MVMVFGTMLICSLQPAFSGLVCIKKKTSVLLEMKYTFNKRRRIISVTKKKGIFSLNKPNYITSNKEYDFA